MSPTDKLIYLVELDRTLLNKIYLFKCSDYHLLHFSFCYYICLSVHSALCIFRVFSNIIYFSLDSIGGFDSSRPIEILQVRIHKFDHM